LPDRKPAPNQRLILMQQEARRAPVDVEQIPLQLTLPEGSVAVHHCFATMLAVEHEPLNPLAR
jgi:hypothetical protein